MGKTMKIYLTVCVVALTSVNVSAYLDPSTMTYVIQAVAGIFIAGGAAVAIYWHKIKLFLKKKKKNAQGKNEIKK